jgi:transcriptional regulator with XRE-family HTH domain
MTEVAQLIATIKWQLKQQGLTYRDVATALRLSEPSVKRLFSSERFTIARLAQVGELLGFTLAELAQEAQAKAPRLRTLTEGQETELVSDMKLLLVAACALNHWTLADMVASYRLSEAECLKRLLRLDRLGLIDLLPGNRIRVTVARDFDWLADGPIRRFFRGQWQNDFLGASFTDSGEAMAFAHGMLTASALAQMQAELRKLRARFAELHDEGLAAPLSERCGTGLFLALREWEPVGFASLRRGAPRQ